MEEENLRRLLLVVGVAVVFGSLAAAWLSMPIVQQAVSPFLTSFVCSQANGTALFSQPTSREFCNRFGSNMDNVNDALCMFYPDSKVQSCQKLVGLLQERWADCFAYRLSGNTDFAQGAPQIIEYCNSLKSV